MNKKQVFKTSLAAALSLGVNMSALAEAPIAFVTQIQGTVLVNQGKQYVTAQPGQQLHPGDRIVTMEGSRAILVYADECILNMPSNSRLTLRRVDDCSLDTAQLQTVGTQYAQLGLGGEGEAGGLPPPPNIVTDLIAVGAVFAGTGVFIAKSKDDDDDDEDRFLSPE